MENLLTYIRHYNETDDSGALKELLSGASIFQLVEIWDDLEESEILKIFGLLENSTKGELLIDLSAIKAETILHNLSPKAITAFVETMAPDDLADLIQKLSEEEKTSLWDNLNDEMKKEVSFLLRFDEDDAAGLMTPRYTAIKGDVTVKQAISFVRDSIGAVETVYYLYVINQSGQLQGVISLRELLAAQDGQKVEAIMEQDVVYVEEETDQEETANILEEHSLIALPVVDKNRKLLGIVTFDDVIEVIRDEQTEDIYKMGGMTGGTDSYLSLSVGRLMVKRLPWITILLLAGAFTADVIHRYEGLLFKFSFLALFIPAIINAGGNSGTQSSALMIRGLARNEIRFKDIRKILLKESLTGVFIGLIIGLIFFFRIFTLPPDIEVASSIAIAGAIMIVVFVGTVLGTLIPLLIARIGVDPTVAASPLVTTIIDIAGTALYFEFARFMLEKA